jgi:hypothetical protein
MTSVPTSSDGIAGFFRRDGDRFVPSRFTEGPWAPETQAGNATAGLLAWAVDQVPTLAPLRTVRCTFDLLRPTPMLPLEVRTEVVREGKRIQVVDASLWLDDVRYAACRALRVREGSAAPEHLDNPITGPLEVPPPPGGPMWSDLGRDTFPGSVDAVDARHVDSTDPRWSTSFWVRVLVPVVENGPASEVARVCSAADFVSNAVSHADRARFAMINADLSVVIFRPPTSDWLAFTVRTGFAADGVGHSVGWIFDEQGHVATAMTVGLVEDRS